MGTVFKGGGESHVLATRAFKEMTPTDLTLHFGFEFTPEQVLKLNASLEEQQRTRKSLKAERHLRKHKKHTSSEPAAAAAVVALPPKQESSKADTTLTHKPELLHPAPPTSSKSSGVGSGPCLCQIICPK